MEYFLLQALNEAKKAIKHGDIPVGCVIVKNGKIIAKAHNKKEKKQNALLHAEVVAINKACKKVKNFRLDDCELYVTLEPCIMCVGAILSARIKKVYFGALDNRFGAQGLLTENQFNHKCEVEYIKTIPECSTIISNFFKQLRNKKS